MVWKRDSKPLFVRATRRIPPPPSAYPPGKAEGMSPKIGAMTIQVFQDQVDGLARVFGPPALGALPAQRSLEALERRSDLVELLRRGVFLFEPENSAQTVKQIGAFGKSLQKQEERRLVLFKRAQHRSEEHTSELQSQSNLVCRLLLEKKKNKCKVVLVCTCVSQRR